ncbi:thioredoxin family protein [Sphingomonas sp.]|uniref:DUF1223 domain-containing protein n=1 Tax=Sphingomonas sp. TaxID=28214 RepID=UPI001DEF0390|nr:DUF1223 domain-containing protein [Sphingomonas sp.]MBX9796575.1 DUF1223 domain-containing protein [Sphingomonas sp.]
MRILLATLPALALAACSGAVATPASNQPGARSAPVAQTGDPAHPVVVELYQSQGCSSCPPADRVVNRLADRRDVIPLSFAVTYWDDLGWKDIFADPAYTARQWDYARTAGRPQVATPQVIVNGRDAVLGSHESELNAAIARNVVKDGPSIAAQGSGVAIGAGKAAHAIVWAVRYDPRTLNVAVKAGENEGVNIPHRNIVKQLVQIGSWSGKAAQYSLPAAPAGLQTAILVQNGKGGPILSAAKI